MPPLLDEHIGAVPPDPGVAEIVRVQRAHEQADAPERDAAGAQVFAQFLECLIHPGRCWRAVDEPLRNVGHLIDQGSLPMSPEKHRLI
jgi:hypothetical protein